MAAKPAQRHSVTFDANTQGTPSGTAAQRGQQRYRGVSFRKEYEPQSAFQKLKSKVSAKGGRKRAPSMIHEPTKHMIPPKRDNGFKYTVVLDLDETLIYAREGPLYARPHLGDLLAYLGDNCETVVWTAGVRAYAQAVIRNIDPHGVIDHCIYRHEKWFSGQAGYSKDLALVGRDLAHLLIIENTPDCIRGHEENGILVSDYEGGEQQDNTLPAITKLITDLSQSDQTVPEFLKSASSAGGLLTRQLVPTDLGDRLHVYCLDPAKADEARYNRDLPANSKK